MFLNSLKDRFVLLGLPRILSSLVCLDPDHVLASFVAPLLEQLPSVVEMLTSYPQEDERRVVGNGFNVEFQQLIECPCLIPVWFLQIGRQILCPLFVLLPWWVDEDDVELSQLGQIHLLQVFLDVDGRVVLLPNEVGLLMD